MRVVLFILGLLLPTGALAQSSTPATPAWPRVQDATDDVATRFTPPAGFTRVDVEPGSFAHFVRHLPLRKKGTHVTSHDGAVLMADAAAVVDIDTGKRDLQQCADSVLRVYAEYLWSIRQHEAIAFKFTSGDVSTWSSWKQGIRPVVGRKVRFQKKADPDGSYANFRAYLDNLFMYAGSASLEAYTPKSKFSALHPGDFFVLGGYPGHAVLVLDVAKNKAGEVRVLLGQGYMPAQSFHVVQHKDGAAWFAFDRQGQLTIPTWAKPFPPSSVRRFRRVPTGS